ncbi:CopG family transcriptional regulator [Corynebacterium atypicum]|uniref:CopG family transcriptional regulator n=1 Tax=Corynebacterium atypicum TaxID=191610 RepID=A0ABN4DAN7_9CORY|nr:hypothetical protein [Corynebacterium atypicum]AIG63368.1 CopG family transcriptional regulator [Corynebacterium atypicum]
MAMTLRLSPEHDRALTLLAEAQGTSKQEAASRAILSTAARMLDDAAIAQLAREAIAGRADLASRIRRARG